MNCSSPRPNPVTTLIEYFDNKTRRLKLPACHRLFFFHAYCSAATQAFTDAELLELLTHSRENNTKLGLTGMLLYKNNDFMQVLEGPEADVRKLVDRINRDPRHTRVQKLIEGYSDERQFPSWSMGFSNLDTDEAKKTPGYDEFLNTPLSAGLASDPTACQKLLHLFKKRLR
jgi:hypothetical protein